MMSPQSIQRYLVPLFAAIYLVCSVYLMIPFAIGCVGSGYTGLDSYPYGTPSRPMVYRVLMPTIAGAVRAVIPAAIEKPITEKLIHWRDSDAGKQTVKSLFLRPPPLSDDRIFETASVAFVCYLTLLAFLWMYYTLARAVFPESLAYALLAPLIALQMLPVLTVNNGYIYDFAELFFSCALFTLCLKQRWSLYLFTFTLATLNKETTLFMIIFFATYFYPRLPRMLYIRLLTLQCILYCMIKGALTLYFANYPGELIGPHVTIAGNLDYLWHWGDYKFILLTIVLMAYRWREKPEFLRGTLPMILAHVAVYIVLCVPGEYRDLYWSLPAIILMITHSLVAGVDIAQHPVFARR